MQWLWSECWVIPATRNPKWGEITENLKPGQTASDRPELVARVFHAKLQALIEDLKTEAIFGDVIGRVHTIEFQKRGLPHAHILLILRGPFRPRTAEDVDRVVSAEIPDPERDPDLCQVVVDCMLHGHCDARSPCWKDVKCTKNFPKEAREKTSVAQDGYPKYRRRLPGHVHVKGTGPRQREYNNTHVIPYNPWLSRKYRCHVNVKVTTGIKAVKYIYKYIYKGDDPAMVRLETGEQVPRAPNELRAFTDSRFICAQQAAWRLLHFPCMTYIHLSVAWYSTWRESTKSSILITAMWTPPYRERSIPVPCCWISSSFVQNIPM